MMFCTKNNDFNELLKTMIPLVLSQLSLMGMNVMDATMSGHAGAVELAGVLSLIHISQLIFSSLGKAVVVTEKQLDALGALAGAGPGYAFVIIDALADAGVMVGLPRDLAIIAAAQTLYGAAKMVLDTGAHPAILLSLIHI